MLHLVHRLPGSRTLTPNALAGLLAIAIGALLGAGAMAAWSVARSNSPGAIPLVALDVPASPAAQPAPARVILPADAMALAVAPAAPVQRVESVPPLPEPVVAAPAAAPVAGEAVMFNGRPLRAVRTIRMKVTAYSPDERSCGKWADGITASGLSVWTNGMKLVAADTRILPFRSIISVPGYNDGRPVPVLDRGGAIKGNRLDVLYPTHEVALGWGVQDLEVTVWEYAD